MRNELNSSATEREALPARDAAELCGVSVRHWWSLHAQGRTPASIQLGRSRRWLRSELLAWLRAGCPPRDRREAKGAAL
ncbi:MAG: helix-turn-helix domain-containing protein [Planctomycetes bacterium]|nr:helix-turn-helix domain-containing protein [Planctomycetota bacterium]